MTATLHGGLGRDGHLTQLALEQLALDEEMSATIHGHIETCDACRRQLQQLVQWQAQVKVRPPAQVVLLRRRWPGPWLPAAGAMALAALLLLTLARDPEPTPRSPTAGDTLRTKGAQIDFEVFAYDGTEVRQLSTGDVVHPGERLGFRLRTAHAAHVMVAGVDSRGSAYLCYPYGENSQSRQLAPTPIPVAVDDAVVLDDVPGDEHLVALFCPQPFAFAAVADKLRAVVLARPALPALPNVLDHCLQRELALRKQPRSIKN